MSRPKLPDGAGRRVNIYILQRQLKTSDEIDNLSNFFQICLDIAPDIMAWAMLRERDPKKYNTGRKFEDHIKPFNDTYPQDKLTQKRTKKWPRHSANIQDLL